MADEKEKMVKIVPTARGVMWEGKQHFEGTLEVPHSFAVRKVGLGEATYENFQQATGRKLEDVVESHVKRAALDAEAERAKHVGKKHAPAAPNKPE